MIRAIATLTASLSLFTALGAQAADLRTMMQRPGEWEVTAGGGIMPIQTQRGCYAGDKSVTDLANKNLKDCSQKSVNIDSGMATVDAVCHFQGMQVTVHSTIRPAGDEAFHSESRIHLDGMPAIPGLPGDMTITADGRRTGECQPGDKRL